MLDDDQYASMKTLSSDGINGHTYSDRPENINEYALLVSDESSGEKNWFLIPQDEPCSMWPTPAVLMMRKPYL